MKLYETDREFNKLRIPMDDKEWEMLEDDILAEGCLNPISVWKGIIIDGSKRYRICRKYGLPYEVNELDFASREETIIWVCRERLKDLKKITSAGEYIIGKLFMTELAVRNANVQEKMRLADELAEYRGVVRQTIYTYGDYACFMDELDKDETLFVDLALQGQVRFGREIKKRLKKMDQKERHHYILQVTKKFRNDSDTIRSRRKKTDAEKAADAAREAAIPLSLNVKEMPEYDPDTEVKGLIYTLPMWGNALDRMMQRTKMEMVTVEIKGYLEKGLRALIDQIDKILEVIV